MPRSRSELLLGLLAILGSVLARPHLSSLQELELSSLRTHKQLLQAEIARLFMEQPPRAETQLLLDDLQLRDHQLGLQIENLERISKGETGETQRLAINLTADFEHLQHKLDDLKHQLELLDGRFASQGKQAEGHASETVPPAAPGLGSFLWGPLLSMPEFPQGSVASDQQHNHNHHHHQQDQLQVPTSPSIIKRVLDMLRPSVGVAALRSRWAESEKSTGTAAGIVAAKPTHPLSAEELLPKLQEQRRFLDDAITRLELLAAKKGSKKV
ncbi:uncharacterized protein LOC108097163 [Drosophila ficusphila]|uniref:uncharacterized protein LOC108097163 n=1 Tax=Drosophila ficusphila TaxID=30025 RepID=UPI0007E6C347|nr:uncharacterized protein LOC108097163 [Drosophila ficusphila]